MKDSTMANDELRQSGEESREMPMIGASGEVHKQPARKNIPAPRSGSAGIGIDAGSPFILGGARSAELLQLFLENL